MQSGDDDGGCVAIYCWQSSLLPLLAKLHEKQLLKKCDPYTLEEEINSEVY